MAYCPHCKRDGMKISHVDRCPDKPSVHEAIRAALTSPQDSRYAIGSTHYGIIATARKVPAETTLITHYGSWEAAVSAFGLIRASLKPQPQRAFVELKRSTVPCPHCNRQFSIGSPIEKHTSGCPLRPGVMEIVQALIEDTPGVGGGMDDYKRCAAVYMVRRPNGAPVLPSAHVLKNHFGTWDDMLHAIGLVTQEEAIDAKAAADNARYRAEWREHHAHELDSWGLPVASVQKPVPIVRVLPDGRKATMIR